MAAPRERILRLSGSRNLRDLGGYRSELAGEPRRVRWGLLFRSGHFGELSDEGRADLARLSVATVVDFRIPVERERHPHRFEAGHRPRLLELPIDPGSQLGAGLRIDRPPQSEEGVVRVMEEMNRSLVRDHAPAYRRLFEVLLEDGAGGAVFHCASGKDRTGTAAALVLSALGVDRGTVLRDFLLTNQAFGVEREVERAIREFLGEEARLGGIERLRPMFEVRASYLEAAFDEIDRSLGGLDAYLRDRMGLDDDRLRALRSRYLEPA